MSNEDVRGLLIELGAERLADSLLELAVYDNYAGSVVKCITASPNDNMEAFKARLNDLSS